MTPYKLIIETIDPSNLSYLCEQKNKNEEPKYFIEGPFIMTDEKNHNGRIYESTEMDPAVEVYIENYVKNSRGLGEMNHPECSLASSDVLTVDGWKSIVDVKVGEKVPTLNQQTGEIEIHPVRRKIDQPYNGKMYRLHGKSIDITVTPNHRFPLVGRSGVKELVKVQDIVNDRKKYNKYYIEKLGNWYNDSPDVFILKGVNVEKLGNFKNDVTKDINIDISTFVKFIGIWLAEGHLQGSKDKQCGGSTVCITQKKPQTIKLIRDMLKGFPEELTWSEYTTKNGKVIFKLSDIRLFVYLKKLGDCYNKYIPSELKQLDPVLLDELLHWFNIGDGRSQINEHGNVTKNIFSVSKRLIDDMHEILLKSGGSGNIQTIITEKDYVFADHIIKAENKQPLYQLHFSTTKGIYLDDRFLNIDEVYVDENVYCITVQNETFYIRENGKSCWSGNSPDVDLERACDKLVSLRKEGNFWVGKAACLSTPMGKLQASLIRDGVKIGKSTRCLGQLTEGENGVNYVKTPNVRAIDTVWEPSGQGKDNSCFVNGILENKDFIIRSDNQFEVLYDKFQKSLNNLPLKDMDNYITENIISFINGLRAK